MVAPGLYIYTVESEGIECYYVDSDGEIVDACSKMASMEGIFCELASAASVAGILKLYKAGWNFKGKRVVCIITGSGLKQPDMTEHMRLSDIVEIPSSLEALKSAISASRLS